MSASGALMGEVVKHMVTSQAMLSIKDVHVDETECQEVLCGR